MSHFRRVALSLVSAGLLGAGAATVAQSDGRMAVESDSNDLKAAAGYGEPFDPGFTSVDVAYAEAQVPLIELVDEIARLAPSWGGGSLEGSRIDPPHATVILYWHGVVPAQLNQRIEREAAAGNAVTVVAAPFGNDELAAAADRILDAVGYVDSVAIGASEGNRGVEIFYPGADGPVTIDGVHYDALDELLAAVELERSVSAIPVTIKPGDPISLGAPAIETLPASVS